MHVVGAAIIQEGRCLVAQRGPGMALAGSWEFPGGKVERGESPQSALSREVQEELGIEIEIGLWIGRGESVVQGREIVLDVYCSNLVSGEPRPTEHSETRWITSDQLGGLDWADADRPILPFLRRILDRGLGELPFTKPIPIVSVDWAKPRKGRAVYTACPKANGWRIERPKPPEGGWSFEEVLSQAQALAGPMGGSCLVAIDAVLGLPAGYGLRSGEDSFPSAMEWLDQGKALEKPIRDATRWRPRAPFFAVDRGEGGLNRYIESAGGRATVFRQLERITGGKTVFVISGIRGAVGGGSIALWREILAVRRSGTQAFRIWPFEVELSEVQSTGCPVIAESYPRACYAVALAPNVPANLLPLSKTDASERTIRLAELREAAWLKAAGVTVTGTEWAERSEDDFDALMQAAALVRLVSSNVPLSTYLVDPTWEGGILGTGGIIPREPGVPGSRSQRRRNSPSALAPTVRSIKRCPIEGCTKAFQSGRLGWDAHVGSLRIHPDWEPRLLSPEERKDAFRRQFGDWFE
ncbi:MAG: hypothetical protein CME06_04205 [Gemmatimonadetes bacterium]|nr:hypothetical protein [Gemmatimonadota bacterium]